MARTAVRLALPGGTDSVRSMRCCWLVVFGTVVLAGRMPAADGAAVYESNCMACHGPDGRAQTPQGRKVKASNLRESRFTDEEIMRRIREGARNKAGVAVMPSFAKELSDEEIRAVLPVVKAFRPPPKPAR